MTDTSARLLSLLSLLQTPREWPGSELAGRLGVSPRTIRRDIERLRDLGYPVQATMGAVGGYRLAAGTAMPPLLLDDEEAVARLRYRVGALGAATVPLAGYGPSVDPETLTTLSAAIASTERVRFGYRSAEGAQSDRLVEPNRLVASGRRWYLIAYDSERGDWRIFRVDRIRDPRRTGVRTPPRALPTEDAAAYLTGKLYDRAPTYQAVVTLHAPTREATVQLGDAYGELEPIDDRTCRLRTPADTLEWLAFRLVQLGCEFEVHEPPELIGYLSDLASRINRAVVRR